MLGLMYRSKSWEVGVAGLGPVHLYETSTDSVDGAHDVPSCREVRGINSTCDERDDSGASLRCSRKEGEGLIKLLQHDAAWRTEVENIDVSDLVPSHLLYADCLRSILHRVGIPTPGE